jgi:hypothetical protein
MAAAVTENGAPKTRSKEGTPPPESVMKLIEDQSMAPPLAKSAKLMA